MQVFCLKIPIDLYMSIYGNFIKHHFSIAQIASRLANLCKTFQTKIYSLKVKSCMLRF